MEGSLKETPYEKRIQRLMTGEDGDQYGFYINITDNIVREVKTRKKPAGRMRQDVRAA